MTPEIIISNAFFGFWSVLGNYFFGLWAVGFSFAFVLALYNLICKR